MLNADPTCAKLRAETAEPIRLNIRTETLDPKCRKSNTDIEDARVVFPMMLKSLPSLQNCLTLAQLPIATKSKIETWLPRRLKERMLKLDPNSA
jgi:hypothetical protein